jgi:hypothetical protein
LDEWREKGSRHRHWVILPEARRLLSDPVLAELATKLAHRVAPQLQPTAARITR